MTTPPSMVYVVDDDDDMRRSLRWLLESVGLSVATFATAEEFLSAYAPPGSGCLLLDIRMPGMGGIRLLERLQNQMRHLPVIVFTGHGDVPMAVRAMKKGALDFLEKPASHQDILDSIQDALEFDRRQRLEDAEFGVVTQSEKQLSDRERQVLERIVDGDSNKIIALNLAISERTVEKHRENIMQKMGARSLAHLIRMVLWQRQITSKH